jgi:hypothetical protein
MNYSNREIFSTLDLEDFSWLPLWKRDQELRADIDNCRKEIKKIRESPVSREEVKRQFEQEINLFKEKREKLINLKAQSIQTPNIQLNKEEMISPFSKCPNFELMSCFCIFEIPEIWQEIEHVIAELPKGISQEEKKQLIAAEEAKIDNFYKEIKEKLSPKQRWLHDRNGNPRPYPGACRWKRYVDVLNVILPHLEELADIDNKPLNAKAKKNFKECGFDKLAGTAKTDRLFKIGERIKVDMTINLDCD